jgi:SAM-dependent methyltransferase
MIQQRPRNTAPVLQGRAEALPFADRSFDGVLGALTVHHWSDPKKGLAECARVARNRLVFFTIDPVAIKRFWLFEYFPSLMTIDLRVFPGIEHFADAFGSVAVAPVPIPEDCLDGFLGAYWRRPAAYLDPLVRGGISTFSKMSQRDLDWGLEKLQTDIDSGVWGQRHAGITDRDVLDVGYRIVTSERRSPHPAPPAPPSHLKATA